MTSGSGSRVTGAARTAAKWTLSRPAAFGLGRWLHRRHCLVLSFHNIVPRGEPVGGERSLHLPEDRFAEHLDFLAETFDVVPLQALLAAPPADVRGRIALTFDDAYAGTLAAGVEQVARRALPATVFVPPGLLGTAAFWWDELSSPETGQPPPAFREEVLAAGARPHDVQRLAARYGLRRRPVPQSARPGTEAALLSAARRPGITLGSHTWSHVALPALGAAEAEEELRRSAEWLEGRAGAVPWLSYPFGLSCAWTEGRASAAGYDGAVRGAGGWLPPEGARAAPFAIPRVDIAAGTTLPLLRMRLSGLLPA